MKALVVFGLLSFALYAQQPAKNTVGCGVVNARTWQNYGAYEYQKSLVSLLGPPERALVSVSVFVTGNTPKYFLRMKAPNLFELIRATPTEALPVIIERLRSAGELPVSPREAIKLVDFKWERKVLSPADFERIYGGFSNALSQYASNVAKRPLQDGDRIILHAPEFSIGYTTAGFETFEITAMPSSDQPANVDDPIAKWAVGFIEEARRRFDAGSDRQIGAREADTVKTFLQSYVARTSSKEEAKETTYSTAFVDLNDDRKREAIVYLTGSPWCGTGGAR